MIQKIVCCLKEAASCSRAAGNSLLSSASKAGELTKITPTFNQVAFKHMLEEVITSLPHQFLLCVQRLLLRVRLRLGEDLRLGGDLRLRELRLRLDASSLEGPIMQ